MSTTPQVIWDSDVSWDAPKDDYSGPEYLRHAKPRGLSNPRTGMPMGEFQPATDAARQAEEEHQRNLTSVARTGAEIPGSATRSSRLRTLSGLSGLAEGVFSPAGAAIIAAQTDPFTAAPVDAALVGHGLYRFGSNVSKAFQGYPDAAGETLGGLSEAVGGAAAFRAAPSFRGAVRSAAYTPEGVVKPDLAAVGQALRHPTELPGRALTGIAGKIFGPPELAPVYPGAFLPSAEDFYSARGTDLLKRGTAQDVLDRRAAIAERSSARAAAKIPPELGSPENPGWMSKIPSRMPKPAEPLPVRQTPFPGATASSTPVGAAELPPPAAQTPFPVVQEAGAAPSAPRIVPPSVGEPRFTGSEGRAATWDKAAVMRLASQGNREAISQAVRRGLELPPGARYVMGDPDFSRAVYNPRTVTQFTPEGEPIRNVENPTVPAPRERIQVSQSAPASREVINASTGEVTSPFAPPSGELPSGNPSPFASQRRTLERGVTTPYDLPTEGEVLAEQIRQARGSVLNRPKMTEGEALNQIMRDPAAYEKYKLADKKTRDAMLVKVARGSAR